jgi:hypothetical protein
MERAVYSGFFLRVRSTTVFFLLIYADSLFSQQHSATANEQKIQLDVLVLADNKKVADSITVTVIGRYDSTSYISVASNLFVIYLNYHDTYYIKVTEKNCNTKILYLDTNCPLSTWNLKAEINLTTKNRNIVKAGALRYNNDLQTFVKYAVK